MTTVEGGVVHAPGEGNPMSAVGVNVTVKADSAETDGAFTVIEY